jgi:hypothetical protein
VASHIQRDAAIARLLVIRQILTDDSKKVLVGEHEFDTIHLVVHPDTAMKNMQFRFGRMLNKVSASARMYRLLPIQSLFKNCSRECRRHSWSAKHLFYSAVAIRQMPSLRLEQIGRAEFLTQY